LAENDENRVVPPLLGDHAGLAVRDARHAREYAQNQNAAYDDDMDVDNDATVNMVILDGLVTGPVVCVSDF
jgi:hypothetical protein